MKDFVHISEIPREDFLPSPMNLQEMKAYLSNLMEMAAMANNDNLLMAAMVADAYLQENPPNLAKAHEKLAQIERH